MRESKLYFHVFSELYHLGKMRTFHVADFHGIRCFFAEIGYGKTPVFVGCDTFGDFLYVNGGISQCFACFGLCDVAAQREMAILGLYGPGCTQQAKANVYGLAL